MEQIKEIISQLKLYLRLDMAFADKIEEIEKRLYKLEENDKLRHGSIRSLETRYSEMLYILKSRDKDVK